MGVVRVVKISIDTWKSVHQPSDWTPNHTDQFEELRRIFDSDLPGFRGYEISIGEIKVMFDTQTQANHLVTVMHNNVPLMDDLVTTEISIVLNQTFRYPYIAKVE